MQAVNKRARSIAAAASVITTLFVVTSATPTQAEMITFGYTGAVSYVNNHGYEPDDPILVGESFSGWFEFDTETPDRSTASPLVGSYYDVGRMAFAVHDIYGVSPTNSEIEIAAGGLFNNWFEISQNYLPFDYGDYSFGEFFIMLDAPDENVVLVDDTLPTTPADLSGLTDRSLLIVIHGPDQHVTLWGTIDSVYLVPEPGSLLLLSFGALAVWRRRQRI